MQAGGQEASVARKSGAEAEAQRLDEGAAETAEIDAEKRITLKSKAQCDPSDSEMEDSLMNSLVELWQRRRS